MLIQKNTINKQITSAACGGTIQASNIPQIIILPLFPNNLPTCVINITASNDQNRLNIRIPDSITINHTLFCENAYVDLTTGNCREGSHSNKF